jgi:hypothetical protein
VRSPGESQVLKSSLTRQCEKNRRRPSSREGIFGNFCRALASIDQALGKQRAVRRGEIARNPLNQLYLRTRDFRPPSVFYVL